VGDIVKLGRIEYYVLEHRKENLVTETASNPNLFCPV